MQPSKCELKLGMDVNSCLLERGFMEEDVGSQNNAFTGANYVTCN